MRFATILSACFLVLFLNGCTLIDGRSTETCYSYVEPVADASGVVGEWRLALVYSFWPEPEHRCTLAADYFQSIRLSFGADGAFEMQVDGVVVGEDSAYTVTGGMVIADGNSYVLRPDGKLVRDLSPIDGPVYVFER